MAKNCYAFNFDFFYYTNLCLYLRNSGLCVREKYHAWCMYIRAPLQWLLGPLVRNNWFRLGYFLFELSYLYEYVYIHTHTCIYKCNLYLATILRQHVIFKTPGKKILFLPTLNIHLLHKASNVFIPSFSRTENFLFSNTLMCLYKVIIFTCNLHAFLIFLNFKFIREPYYAFLFFYFCVC